MNRKYGQLTGSAIGLILKELVRRAIVVIRQNRLSFNSTAKLGYDGISADVFTNADLAAQEVYIKMLREVFPKFGIVAEESNLVVPCTLKKNKVYFTIDPLDGTKAFTRGQSHGIGTMISLVYDDEVIASAVGDVNTQEIFYYRPDSDKVHRLFTNPEMHEQLVIDGSKTLKDQRWLIRDPACEYSSFVQSLFDPKGENQFKYSTSDGSIGIMMARLWKSEVGAVILKPGIQTPWDFQPIYGISKKLGFLCLEIEMINEKVVGNGGYIIDQVLKQTHGEIFFIHHNCFSEFYNLIRSFNGR